MRFASAFLSYNHDHADLVAQVAEALGRRGIIAWRDKAYLQTGELLDQALPRAVQDQVVFVPFISERSLGSYWCQQELKAALKVERTLRPDDAWITPVFLGDAMALWRASDGALGDWMTPDHARFRKLYVAGTTAPDPEHIADEIAKVVYRRLKIREAEDVAIIIDQRGQGEPTGHPGHALVPPNALSQSWPALTFRPSSQPRSEKALVDGADWDRVAATLRWTLGEALPATRARANLWVYGDGQLSLFYLLGVLRDRTSGATLYCNRSPAAQGDLTLTNKGWSSEGKPKVPKVSIARLARKGAAPAPNQTCPEVGLRIMEPGDFRLQDAQDYAEATRPSAPLLTLEHVPVLTQHNVEELVDRVEALARALREAHRAEVIHLYTTLPVQALPLFAWRLNGPGLPEVVFMEYRHKARSRPERLYAPLKMQPDTTEDEARGAPEPRLGSIPPASVAPSLSRRGVSPALYGRMLGFLKTRYTPEQILILARTLQCADQLVPALKAGALAPEQAADDLLSALQRLTGGLPADLFDRLSEDRPSFRPEVTEMRVAYEQA